MPLVTQPEATGVALREKYLRLRAEVGKETRHPEAPFADGSP